MESIRYPSSWRLWRALSPDHPDLSGGDDSATYVGRHTGSPWPIVILYLQVVTRQWGLLLCWQYLLLGANAAMQYAGALSQVFKPAHHQLLSLKSTDISPRLHDASTHEARRTVDRTSLTHQLEGYGAVCWALIPHGHNSCL